MILTSNIDKYKNDIQKLIKAGEAIFKKMKDDKNLAELIQDYEIWDSESIAVIKIIRPDRISITSTYLVAGASVYRHILSFIRFITSKIFHRN